MRTTPFLLQTAPAFRVSVILSLGIVAADWLPSWWPLPPLVGLLWILLTVCLGVVRLHLSAGCSSLLAMVLCFLMGFGSVVLGEPPDVAFPPEGVREAAIVGRVVDAPTRADDRWRFPLAVKRTQHPPAWRTEGTMVLVTVLPGRNTMGRCPVQYGMVVALRGAVRPPPPARNPGEFDSRAYYGANGVELLMTVRGTGNLVVLDSNGGCWFLRSIVIPVREETLRCIDETIGGEEGEYLKGLLLGVRAGLSAETREAFVNAGVAHILAVSGSNVAVIAGALLVMLTVLRIPPSPRTAILSLVLVFYMLLTGSQPPVVRATVMALVLLWGLVVEECVNPLNAIGVAALFLLAGEPRQLFDVGFQLSFAAVLSLLLFYPHVDGMIRRIPGKGLLRSLAVSVGRICGVSLVATIGTLPCTALWFGKISIAGILSNIVVVPAAAVSLVLGIIALVASQIHAGIAAAYASVNQLILQWTLCFTIAVGGSPWSAVEIAGLPPLFVPAYYAALLLLFSGGWDRWRRRLVIGVIGLVVVAILLDTGEVFIRAELPVRVTFLDVGQGDAILVEMPEGRTMLIDAGSRTPTSDSGKRTIAPYLRRRGIHRIDWLVLTHAHTDHIGGAASLLRQFPVHVLVAGPRSLSEICVPPDCEVIVPTPGGVFMPTPAVRLNVLAHQQRDGDDGRRGQSLNNESIVLLLRCGTVTMLLAGDAEGPLEALLVRTYGDILRSTLLKAGHHGAATSTSGAFLSAVCPAHVVLSVGALNAFGHPSPVVLDRLAAAGIGVARTDVDGAIILETDGKILRRVFWR